MSAPLASTYIWREGKVFCVSTINRESSAALAYGRAYAETIAWECNPETRERLRIIGQDEASEGSIRIHQQIVERLHATGQFELPGDDA